MSASVLPLVEFRAVEKRYGNGSLVLDRITFAVQPRDFVSIIGPSGCGKSTLLRLVAGLSPVSAGSLTIEGRPPADTATDLAFVFQEPTLLPWLTVSENIRLPQRLRAGATAALADPVPEKMLSLTGLARHSGFYPRQLSGGQKMRASLARALTLSPKLLLLDEPFGALDAMTRERLNEELLAIRAQQAWTALFVTHSVAEAVFLSNRVLILSAHPGRLHAEIAVDLPATRTAELRFTRDYQDLVADVSRQLRAASTAAATG